MRTVCFDKGKQVASRLPHLKKSYKLGGAWLRQVSARLRKCSTFLSGELKVTTYTTRKDIKLAS